MCGRNGISHPELATRESRLRRRANLGLTILPAETSAEELREACRALRGRILREEIYADDETPAAVNPYVTWVEIIGVPPTL